MARELIVAAPHRLGHFRSQLEHKKGLVPNPSAGSENIERYVNFLPTTNLSIQEGLIVPKQILRLLKTDMTGLDIENSQSIDTVFAETVVLGLSLGLPENLDEDMRQMWIEEQSQDYLTRLIDPVAFAEQMAIEVAVHMIPDSLFDP